MLIFIFFIYNHSVKLFCYLVCLIEGHKFISFIKTVTWLPSLNKALPYLAAQETTPLYNKAAKCLRMRQIEHFRFLFQSHFTVRSKSPVPFMVSCVASSSTLGWLHGDVLYCAKLYEN